LARAAAQQMGIQFVERPVASVEELQAGVRAIKMGEVDAFFQLADPMVLGQAQLIIDMARHIRLPTMFVDQSSVIKGSPRRLQRELPRSWPPVSEVRPADSCWCQTQGLAGAAGR
jgi:ABC-type uncharacterized transport system substrate-binding protein